MCCSMRATVFFLASYQIWFCITQSVMLAPTMISSISTQLIECIIAIIYSIIYFCAGFLIFIAADRESILILDIGAGCLLFIIGKRYTTMYLGLLLKPTLPEADFLNPYGTTVPIIFTVLIYIFYLAILFVYHNELKYRGPTTCFTPLPSRRQLPPSMSFPPRSTNQMIP